MPVYLLRRDHVELPYIHVEDVDLAPVLLGVDAEDIAVRCPVRLDPEGVR